jgi:hypothetical protein
MREAPDPAGPTNEIRIIWPHVTVLACELGLLLAASHYFARARRGLWEGRLDEAPPSHVQWSSAAYALTLVIGIITAFQLIQSIRRKSQVLALNAYRCQLMVALGVIACGIRVIIEGYGLVFILWGLLCLWAYTSLDFVKRPFDKE